MKRLQSPRDVDAIQEWRDYVGDPKTMPLSLETHLYYIIGRYSECEAEEHEDTVFWSQVYNIVEEELIRRGELCT